MRWPAVTRSTHDRALAALDANLAEAAARAGTLAADLAQANARIAELEEPATPVPLTEEQRTALHASRCSHCGGAHVRACPRVKRIRFRPDATVLEVEFWEHWDDTNVVWLENVEEPVTTTGQVTG